MTIRFKFVFIAATVVTILIAGSVLMSVLQTTMTPFNEQAANIAETWARTFLGSAFFVLTIAVVLMIFIGKIPKGLL